MTDNDLISQLREYRNPNMQWGPITVSAVVAAMCMAADEIERLTRELDAKETEWRLQEQMKNRAVAERDTAREALREATQVLTTACGTEAPYIRTALARIDTALAGSPAEIGVPQGTSAKLREIAGDLADIASNPPREIDSNALARLASQLQAVSGQVYLGEQIDLRRHQETEVRPKSWTCSNCGNRNDGNNSECWARCGMSRAENGEC